MMLLALVLVSNPEPCVIPDEDGVRPSMQKRVRWGMTLGVHKHSVIAVNMESEWKGSLSQQCL